MPSKNGNGNDNIAGALAEISDRLTRLVQDEIELAKTEMTQKAKSIGRGVGAVAAGAVFGVFAVIFLLSTLAWVFNDLFVPGAGALWVGFLIVFVLLLLGAIGAFLFAWKALSVGAPTPKMAIDEGKKIKNTVTTMGGPANGNGKSKPAEAKPVQAFAAVAAPTPALEPKPTPAAATAPAVTPEPAAEPEPAPATPPEVSADPDLTAAAPAPEAVPTPEETPTPKDAPLWEAAPASDDAPTFVSVPEPEGEDDPPTLISDSDSTGEKPTDDDSTTPEN